MGGKNYRYEYDVNGLRTRKTNSDGGYTQYYIMDGLTVAEQRFSASGAERGYNTGQLVCSDDSVVLYLVTIYLEKCSIYSNNRRAY